VGNPSDFQPVAIGPQHGRNNGHPLPGFGEGEQRVRRAALEQNIGLDIGKTAGRIEQPANRVTGVQQQQGLLIRNPPYARAREGVTRKQHFAERLNLVEQDRGTLRERYRK
jgi:hypothetical protein